MAKFNADPLKRVVRPFVHGVLDLIYPPRCLVCGRFIEFGALCQECPTEFLPVAPPFCSLCGDSVEPRRTLCQVCEGGVVPTFDWSHVMGRYAQTLRVAIINLKYNHKTALARPLASLLSASFDRSPLLWKANGSPHPAFDLVVPVPLHPRKERQRGFNQSERIARIIAEIRGWPLEPHALRRLKYTRTQTALSLGERAMNVHGAFEARDRTLLRDKSVLIVDDVITTYATARECARVARAAGATRVCIVALARDI